MAHEKIEAGQTGWLNTPRFLVPICMGFMLLCGVALSDCFPIIFQNSSVSRVFCPKTRSSLRLGPQEYRSSQRAVISEERTEPNTFANLTQKCHWLLVAMRIRHDRSDHFGFHPSSAVVVCNCAPATPFEVRPSLLRR